jgi:hypothetical protein
LGPVGGAAPEATILGNPAVGGGTDTTAAGEPPESRPDDVDKTGVVLSAFGPFGGALPNVPDMVTIGALCLHKQVER